MWYWGWNIRIIRYQSERITVETTELMSFGCSFSTISSYLGVDYKTTVIQLTKAFFKAKKLPNQLVLVPYAIFDESFILEQNRMQTRRSEHSVRLKILGRDKKRVDYYFNCSNLVSSELGRNLTKHSDGSPARSVRHPASTDAALTLPQQITTHLNFFWCLQLWRKCKLLTRSFCWTAIWATAVRSISVVEGMQTMHNLCAGLKCSSLLVWLV